MSPVKKPGRPRTNFPSPSEFGMELTFEQLGQCMGMTRKKAQAMVVDNGIPVITRGRFRTVHKKVADLLISGEWWTRQQGNQRAEEAKQDVEDPIPATSGSLRDAYLRGFVHGNPRADGTGRRSTAVGGQA